MRSVDQPEGMNDATTEDNADQYDFGPAGRHAPGCGRCDGCKAAQAEARRNAHGEGTREGAHRAEVEASEGPRAKVVRRGIQLFRAKESDVLRALMHGQIHQSEVQFEIDHAKKRVIIRYGVGLC